MKQITELKEAKNQLIIMRASIVSKMGGASQMDFFRLRDDTQAIDLILNELNDCKCHNQTCTCDSFSDMIDAIEKDKEAIKESLNK